MELLFLSAPYNYAFQLNVDWFKPFKHTQHSEGAVYLSIMNLPRKERFLQENIILACVIPGPRAISADELTAKSSCRRTKEALERGYFK